MEMQNIVLLEEIVQLKCDNKVLYCDNIKLEATVPYKNQIQKKDINYSRIYCELCNKKFKNYDLYISHLAKHGSIENGSSKLFKCHECGKEYKTLLGLKYHISYHKGIKKHKCSFENCKWSFISKNALEKHLTTHSDKKMILCSICGKKYSTQDALAHHEKSHSGTRPHKCDYCDKTFLQSCHLKSHMASHKGVRPYICESCGRSYTTNSPLKVHFRKYCGRGLEPVFKFGKNENNLPHTVNNNNIVS